MTNDMVCERPDCQNILGLKDLWALTAQEFDAQKKLEQVFKNNKTDNSYVYKLIHHMLL